MANIDGRVDLGAFVGREAGFLSFERQRVAGEEDLLCAVCQEEMGFGAKAAAVVDTHRHRALCQLAADPESGETLRSHIMHTWCAEVAAGMEACPACFDEATGIQQKTRIGRIGFDIGGVIVPHREDRDDAEEDAVGLTREDYLQVEAAPGALVSLSVVVGSLGSENVCIISKCGPETEARTREWMEHSGFFERTGIQQKNVHFCRDVKDKAPIVAKLDLDAFVDDRIDVLRPPFTHTAANVISRY
ncbi:slc35a4, partial [Symbiodinium necroappetens]